VLSKSGDRIAILSSFTNNEEQFRLAASAQVAKGFPIPPQAISIGDTITAHGRMKGPDGVFIATIADVNVIQVRGIVTRRTANGWVVQDGHNNIRQLALDPGRPPVDIRGTALASNALLRNLTEGSGIFVIGVAEPDGTVMVTKVIIDASKLK